MNSQQEHEIVEAVFCALRSGCFFPVPEPAQGAATGDWIRWGALRHLHDVIADATKREQP